MSHRSYNVNVHVYGPDIPHEFSRLYNYTAGIGTHFTVFISSGENSAAIINHYNSAFLFYQVPITAGWTQAALNEKFALYFYT